MHILDRKVSRCIAPADTVLYNCYLGACTGYFWVREEEGHMPILDRQLLNSNGQKLWTLVDCVI